MLVSGPRPHKITGGNGGKSPFFMGPWVDVEKQTPVLPELAIFLPYFCMQVVTAPFAKLRRYFQKVQCLELLRLNCAFLLGSTI